MTLRELRYLVALADLGHFGRAAEACHVSQPTLSTQIRKLEESLGVALFERTNKTLRVTPVGGAATGGQWRGSSIARTVCPLRAGVARRRGEQRRSSFSTQ